jgi:F-type H+-transporting ATPase subunit delta
MKPLTKDARGFVEGVVSYLNTDSKSRTVGTKIKSLLTKVSDEDRKQNRATVVSGVKLTASELAQVERIVAKIIGHSVEIDTSVDKKLIGGLRITVGDWILDTSLASNLEELKNVLI